MSGKYSRDKGKRAERDLVAYLKAKDYQAYRVPFSGAMAKHTGQDKNVYGEDVRAEKNGKKVVFEVKCRGKGFEMVYKYLKGVPNIGFSAGLDCYAVGTDIDQVLAIKEYPSIDFEFHKRVIRKLKSMRKWLPEDSPHEIVLAIKAAREPFIFIRYL